MINLSTRRLGRSVPGLLVQRPPRARSREAYMRRLLKIFAAGSLTAVFTIGSGGHRGARALPMFARKYGVSCATCHTSPPRLNETGYRFRAAGFRMPEEIGKRPEVPFDIYDYVSARVQVRAEVSRSKAGAAATMRHQFLLQAL